MKTIEELLIEALDGIKEDLLALQFTADRSIQVDRIDAVIDWLKEK
jgi:hypothetical protein